ncbi:heme-binding protein [Streptomyces sp. TRM76323]|uniref:Heme-binding protein n=1 Tax=Streptomyces tamarix TaxID=3078565 RepID=A0ABU3QGW6_9ACTN|nr:heme-binding protein [Streptomyces tamarix]MDT9682005.1 heme-binding protein [Streptomyces tamarix]
METHREKSSPRTRLLIGGLAAAALAAGTFGAVSATASASTPQQAQTAAGASAPQRTQTAPEAADRNTHQTRHLTVDAATRAAQAALKAARQDGRRVTVAVVDRDGNTIAVLRGDGAGPQSYESAERKAYTAVSWNAPTSALVERLETTPTLKDIPGTLFLGGGVPVAVGGTPVAGIGVAGAPSGALDEEYARAGAAALGLR